MLPAPPPLLPPPAPGHVVPRPQNRRRKPRLHPQVAISRFWSQYHVKAPGKVTSIFTRDLYRGLDRDASLPLAAHGSGTPTPRGAVHNAGHNYISARAECEDMVRKAVRRCEQTNTRFTDFGFDIETDHALGFRNCLFGLDREGEYDSDSDSDDEDDEDGDYKPSPGSVRESMGVILKSGLLDQSNVLLDPARLKKYLRGSGAGAGDSARRRRRPLPQSVHRLDWIFESPRFTVDGYSSSDIKQGSGGNCWWLAAVSNIAHRRDLMDRVCVARDEECGVYGFVFYRDGEWVPTLVDDNLYLASGDFGASLDSDIYDARGKKARLWKKQNQTGSEALFFSKCEDENETWLPLLEKAYAKVHGDYGAIDGGWTGSGVEDLTGGVNSMLQASRVLRKERLWREMLSVDQERGEFVFGLSAASEGRSDSKNGIVQRHAYSVLKVTEVEDPDGNKFKLVKLRNPWGQRSNSGFGEWHGPWSDGSKEWTPYMMQRLRHEFADDGVFWMAYDDVLSNFKWIHRTRLFDDRWTVAQQWTSENINWMPGYLGSKFLVEVKEAGLVVIVLSKLDGRYFKGLEGQYWYYLEFAVREAGSSETLADVRATPSSDQRSVNCEMHLDRGVYEVLPKVTAERFRGLRTVEDVVKVQADANPQKLRQVGMQYDMAHAKAGVLDEDAEHQRKKQKVRARRREQRRKQDKMAEMRDAMVKMQLAMSRMKEEGTQRDQSRGGGTPSRPDRDEAAAIDGPEDGVSAKKEREPKEEADDKPGRRQPPGFWPGDSSLSGSGPVSGPSGQGDNDPNEARKAGSRPLSKATEAKVVREAPATPSQPSQPEPEPAAEPQPEPRQPGPKLLEAPQADQEPSEEPEPEPEPQQPQPQPAKADLDSDSDSSDSTSDSESDCDSDDSRPAMSRKKAPWNPVCVMCLRVYAQDKDVAVKLEKKPLAQGTEVEKEVLRGAKWDGHGAAADRK